MKPYDLLQDIRAVGHSQDENTLNRYAFQDVITSYIKNSFGVVFLIKGKIKPFAFVVIKQKLSYNYNNLKQIPIREFFNLRDLAQQQENQEVVFINEELEKKINALCLLEELRDKD